MASECWHNFYNFFILYIILLVAMSESGCNKELFEDRSRYDHYRIYNVELDTEKHVELFQKLEEQSDSMIFIGHAREVGQKLSILVAAHKVADLWDLLQHYQVKHRILVSFCLNTLY